MQLLYIWDIHAHTSHTHAHDIFDINANIPNLVSKVVPGTYQAVTGEVAVTVTVGCVLPYMY